ncbi:MAG: NADPH-dependent 7-cyano-7-deazaguanine reductase QueF [Rickettsiaceae bacterium]|nr:NADPH-dependent 7-cyano-7-deazaguanine reductase QueF [Rickettsiaceae bacterium]
MNKTILGKETNYSFHYDSNLLFPIPRKLARDKMNWSAHLEKNFHGIDIWNCYEMSWLAQNGLPQVRILRLYIDASSPNIVESKSLKLYLTSFSNDKFDDQASVLNIIKNDLSKLVDTEVKVVLMPLNAVNGDKIHFFKGQNIDNVVDIEIKDYNVNKELLSIKSDAIISEELYSNLLKSNCLVTNQPDWASIYIKYKGKQIDHVGLLKYIISFRNHNEFHEQCIERIFIDIMDKCMPEELTIYAKYTRRGGIDINPYRTNIQYSINDIDQTRDIRQ